MLDAVDDGAVLSAENDVAVLAHDFHNQFLAAQVPHLVQVLQIELDDAL